MKKEKGNVYYLVCLYGLYDHILRTPIELDGYTEYLDALVELYRNNIFDKDEVYFVDLMLEEKIPSIILCGGITNKQLEVSEARSVFLNYGIRKKILNRLGLPENSEYVQVYLEENSVNTAQNIYNGMSRIIARDVNPNKTIYVICDKFRKFKVKMILRRALSLFVNTGTVKVIALKRKDIHPHSNYIYQFFAGLRYLSYWNFVKDANLRGGK